MCRLKVRVLLLLHDFMGVIQLRLADEDCISMQKPLASLKLVKKTNDAEEMRMAA